jgi:hypothetical protein
VAFDVEKKSAGPLFSILVKLSLGLGRSQFAESNCDKLKLDKTWLDV